MLSDLIEHPANPGVKPTVKTVRLTLALLLPVLWLVASDDCVNASVSRWANSRFPSLSANRHANPDASRSEGSFKQSARCWSRRCNLQNGPDGFPAAGAISDVQNPRLDRVAVFAPCSDISFGLAQCWQFQWRTALNPRAPSLVS
jgi:hypothetical protein